jgi:hypothetical protein
MTTDKSGRQCGNWRTPAGQLMRVVLAVLIRQQRNGAWVLAEFKRLIPDFQEFHNAPITDGAIWSRAATTLRPGYEATHPGYAAAVRTYIGVATQIVDTGVPVVATAFRARQAACAAMVRIAAALIHDLPLVTDVRIADELFGFDSGELLSAIERLLGDDVPEMIGFEEQSESVVVPFRRTPFKDAAP